MPGGFQLHIRSKHKAVKNVTYFRNCVTIITYYTATLHTVEIHLSYSNEQYMETVNNQSPMNIQGGEQIVRANGNQTHNPGLRALLSIKNFSATLEKDYAELLQIENDLAEVHKKGLLVMEGNGTPEAIENWKLNAAALNEVISGMNDILKTAKEKIEKKEVEDVPGLWKQLGAHMSSLKDSLKKLAAAGFESLPLTVQPEWEKSFVQEETMLVQLVVSHVESCRVLLQMIERYTPDELNKITKIIVDQIPADFTYEEAVLYQQDYYKALVNFKKEFKEEKNLWDKFLDILAGGTHQPPSERVMMERWLDGEKGDL